MTFPLTRIARFAPSTLGPLLARDLTIQGLTALVYGTHDPGDFAIRGWGNPSATVQAAMRGMFPPEMPYLHERF